MASLLKVKRDDESLMLTMYWAYFVNGIMGTLIGTLLPFMKAEYRMSYVLSGAVISAHQIGNFVALLVAGFLPYLIGRKKSTVTLASGIIIGFILMTLTGNPAVLLLSFAISGIGRGALSNIANVVMSEIAENKAASLNLLHALFAVGALIVPFSVILLTVTLSLDWRANVWLLVALESVVLILISLSSLSNQPSKRSNGGERGFLTSGDFWLNTAILFFYLCSEASIVGWLVTYFTEGGRLSPALAQMTSSALWLFILAGRLVCAYLSTRVKASLLLLILGLLQLLFFIILVSVDSTPLIYLSIFGFGLAMSGIFPTVLSTVDIKITGSTVAMGTIFAIATLGAIVMPVIVGVVAQTGGMAAGLGTIGIAIAVMVALLLVKFIMAANKRTTR
jgi:fucose permease